MARQPTSVWWAPTGKAHVGKRGHKALCGYEVPLDVDEWDLEEDEEAARAALCSRCMAVLRTPGPWMKGTGRVRPPEAVEVYVGSPTQAWQLNELTWRRVVALAKRQRLTREAVVQVAVATQEAMDDPARQHVARQNGRAGNYEIKGLSRACGEPRARRFLQMCGIAALLCAMA